MSGKRQDVVYQAQAILSRRDHSTTEVKHKLKRKGFSEQEIAKALNILQEQKLLDDTRFAAAFTQSLLSAKPVGPRYLRAKLKQKGVGEEIIQNAIDEVFAASPDTPEVSRSDSSGVAKRGSRGREATLAEQAAQRWKRLHPKHAQDRQRLFRFLASRGFTQDSISAILNNINS